MVAGALATQAAAAGIPMLDHLVVGNVGGYCRTRRDEPGHRRRRGRRPDEAEQAALELHGLARTLMPGMTPRKSPYTLIFYTDASGGQPVREWLVAELSAEDRRTVGAALRELLQEQGIGICGTGFGRQLSGGVFEFRLREEGLLVRVLCHAYGDKLILLLGAYDKGRDPSPRRQETEIATARSRLADWLKQQRG